jgi:hypothetical protein
LEQECFTDGFIQEDKIHHFPGIRKKLFSFIRSRTTQLLFCLISAAYSKHRISFGLTAPVHYHPADVQQLAFGICVGLSFKPDKMPVRFYTADELYRFKSLNEEEALGNKFSNSTLWSCACTGQFLSNRLFNADKL